MGDLSAGHNADLNRLADIRLNGGRLDSLDEQRLRDHQLRRLRRLWLKDQCLSAREPLVPPKKLGFFGRLFAKEEAFWDRHLKFRKLTSYIYHGKDFGQLPMLWTYQFQRFVRNYSKFLVMMVPFFYVIKYGGLEIPGNKLVGKPAIYPGDKYFTARDGDVLYDKKTATYKLTDDPDAWKNVIKY